MAVRRFLISPDKDESVDSLALTFTRWFGARLAPSGYISGKLSSMGKSRVLSYLNPETCD